MVHPSKPLSKPTLYKNKNNSKGNHNVCISKASVEQQRRAKLKHELRKQAQDLPVYAHKQQILATLDSCKTLIVVSATGSGKTTQIPQFLMMNQKDRAKKIAVTQPRKVAAMTVAERVAQEVGCVLGDTVGYSVRFDHKYSAERTRIKYLTDGMLLREALLDPQLKDYSVICLDEAHERTVNTDVLFALLKDLQNSTRPDLKIIVMSATLQTRQFVHYFGEKQTKVLNIPGRSFPVDILYTNEPQKDYIDSTVLAVCQIHIDHGVPGDILVFLTGQDDIETVSLLLKERVKYLSSNQPSLFVLPFYAALPHEQQLKVFEPAPKNARKVILATNIAETSLTISGIKYVVDCGLAKKRQFSPQTGVEMLISMPISRAEAWQRSGRAGREQEGICYRLYSEQTFDKLSEALLPEILRSNLSNVALQLKTIGVDNIFSFDFIDKPHLESLKYAVEEIFSLGCLDEEGNLTELGRQLAKLPIDPKFGKALLCAKAADCLTEVLTIISLLSVESLFYTPHEEDEKEKADSCRCRFSSPYGDHLTLLNIFKAAETARFDKKWCRDNYIHYRSLYKARDIRKQLEDHMQKIHFPMKLEFSGSISSEVNAAEIQSILARRCLLMGLFSNTARRQEDGSYQTLLHHQTVQIHPTSVLFSKRPQFVMFTELVFTTKHYLRGVSVIDSSWLPQAAPQVFSLISPQKDR